MVDAGYDAMKLALLTTETSHHTWFLQELQKKYDVPTVCVETGRRSPSFPTDHPYEHERDIHERKQFFDGEERKIEDLCRPNLAPSINDPLAVNVLKEARPDIIMVFGTGIVGDEIISLAPAGIINLHGGDPEEYRGLDTHLWAIYHRDFNGLITTLHRLTPELDGGEIIRRCKLPVTKGMRLHELRRLNTSVCLELVLSALSEWEETGTVASFPQQRAGRYYSAMPSVLKEICLKRFHRYTEQLG